MYLFFFLLGIFTFSIYGEDSPSVDLEENIEVVVRSLNNSPCSNCHGQFEPGEVEITSDSHEGLRGFKHMKHINTCTFCHNSEDPDQLVDFISGKKLPISQSHQICGQCHGEKYRDWSLGIHGKQIGNWNGKKKRSSCTLCHDPHSPQFPKMQASPPPVKPKFLIDKSDSHENHKEDIEHAKEEKKSFLDSLQNWFFNLFRSKSQKKLANS